MPYERDTKRKSPISYRPPEALRDEFLRRVSESGLSANAFLTEAWHGRSRHRPAEIRLLTRLLGECAAIADLVRAAAKSGDAGHDTALLEAIRTLLTEIRSALFLLMGRKP